MLELSGISKSFGELSIIKNFNLAIQTGEVVVIIGPSGTGKSTLLRCVNFLEYPTAGSITLDGLCIQAGNSNKKDILALRKEISMVFQNYNLFANKTALENIMEPMLIAQKMDKAKAEKRAMELLQLISLADKRDSYPSQLSGGQQQRIGIGRAMGTSPKAVLFDEPTSSLDPGLVGEVLDVIRKLAQESRITMLITTHEMEFARSIADKVVFLDNGEAVESGTPDEIFCSAKDSRTRSFLSAYYP